MLRFFGTILLIILANTCWSQTYFLNGDAEAVGDDCYQLTAAQGNQSGTVWYADQLDLTENFSLVFEMNFGSNDANGADGMVFVLHQLGTSAIGTSGGGMGYLNFGTSVGIEFDTWDNTNYGDLSADHIALMINGSVDHNSANNISGPVQANPNFINIEDGQNHTVQINWYATQHIFRVWFDCSLRITAVLDAVQIFGGDPLVYWGFTGATGGAWNTQTVCLAEDIITVGESVSICNGASTILNVGGDPDGAFNWQPPDGLDDPFSPSPTASPTETTTYIVSYSDLCGQGFTDTVTVVVETLEAWALESELVLTCTNTSGQLSAENNFDNNVDYLWTTDDGNIVSGSNSQTSSIDSPGTYYVTVSFADACYAYDTVVVTGDFNFDVTIDPVELLNCINGEVDIDADASMNTGVDYSWSTDNGTITTDPEDDQITVTDEGDYTVVAYLNEYCQSTATVTVQANFETFTAEAGPNQVVNCYSSSTALQGSTDGGNAIILWSTGNGTILGGFTTLSPTVTSAGTYTITVTNPASGCQSTDQVTVEADFVIPTVEAGLSDTLTCREPFAEISGLSYSEGNMNLSWTTVDGNIVSGSGSPTPIFDAPGTYTLTVTNIDNGCTNSDQLEVFVNDDFYIDITQLTIPNVFSPGTDNLNDYWKPYLANDPEFDLANVMEEFDLQIFNRWGNLIYTSDGYVRQWDGRVDGKILDTGTYYYLLTYHIACGVDEVKSVQGNLQLLVK
jgi:gliding motility-associated-like protein